MTRLDAAQRAIAARAEPEADPARIDRLGVTQVGKLAFLNWKYLNSASIKRRTWTISKRT